MIQKADFWRLVCFLLYNELFLRRFHFWLIGNVVTFKRYLKVARLFSQELHSTAYIYNFFQGMYLWYLITYHMNEFKRWKSN